MQSRSGMYFAALQMKQHVDSIQREIDTIRKEAPVQRKPARKPARKATPVQRKPARKSDDYGMTLDTVLLELANQIGELQTVVGEMSERLQDLRREQKNISATWVAALKEPKDYL